MKQHRLIISVVVILLSLQARAEMNLPTSPQTGMANTIGLNSFNPHEQFGTGESIDLADGHVILMPQNLNLDLGQLRLAIGPAFNPERTTLGQSSWSFSSFVSDDYKDVDDLVYAVDANLPLGRMGRLIAQNLSASSSFRMAVNAEQWQFAVNGIVGVIGAEIELGREDHKVTVFFLVKADGNVIFLSTTEQGFRKAYKIIGDDHYGGFINPDGSKTDQLTIEDQDGVQYQFSSSEGFGYLENALAAAGQQGKSFAEIGTIDAETRIQTETLWTSFFFFDHRSLHYNFPAWKGRLFFLKNIKDRFGNEVRISNGGGRDPNRIVTTIETGKTTIGFVRRPGSIELKTHFDPNNPDATADRAQVWNYELDGGERIVSIRDPEGGMTHYRYALSSSFPNVKKLGPVFTRDPSSVVEVEGALGGLSRYEMFTGAAINGVIVTEFPDRAHTDDFFQRYFVADPFRTTIYSEGGAITTYQYRVVNATKVLSEKRLERDGQVLTEHYDWHAAGDVINGMATISNSVDGVTFSTTNEYDNMGRLTRTVNPLGEPITYTYHCDSHEVATMTRAKRHSSGDGGSDTLTLRFEPFLPTECSFNNITHISVSDITFDITAPEALYALLLYIGGGLSADQIKILLEVDQHIAEAISQVEAELITTDTLRLIDTVLTEIERWLPGSRAALFTSLGIHSVDDIHTFVQLRDTFLFLRQQVVSQSDAVIQHALAAVQDGDLSQWNSVYDYVHGTLSRIFSLLPVKPRIPYVVGQVTLQVNQEAPIPIHRYLYELRPNAGSFSSLIGYGNMLAEIDENNVTKTHVYHYCDVLERVGAGGCPGTTAFQRSQLNRQLLLAEVVGAEPSDFVRLYASLQSLVPCFGASTAGGPSCSPLNLLATISGQITPMTFYYYNSSDLWALRGKIDPNLFGQSFDHDRRGQVVKIGFLNGSSVAKDYDIAADRLTTAVDDRSSNPPRAITTALALDGLGFTRQQIDADGRATSYTYARNKKVESITYPDRSLLRYTYDGFDRITRIQFPGGEVFRFTYGRELVSDASGRSLPTEKITIASGDTPFLIYYRDPNQRIVRIDRLGGPPTHYLYAYDELGNVIRSTNPNGFAVSQEYDALSRLNRIITPDGAQVSVTAYQGLQLPASVTIREADLGNIVSNLTYDRIGRLTDVHYVGDAASAVTMSYDQLTINVGGTPLPRLALNRLATLTDPLGRTEYIYEPNGDVLLSARFLTGLPGIPALPPLLTLTARDGFGNPTLSSLPGATPAMAFAYQSDGNGRLTAVRQGSATGTPLVAYRYLDNGRLGSMTFGNGVVQSYSYLSNGRIGSIRVAKGAQIISLEEYTYDTQGNKTRVLYQDNSRVDYQYDPAGNLTHADYFHRNAATPYYWQVYNYDANGNRTRYRDSFREINYHYDHDQLTSYMMGTHTTVNFHYDQRGNVTEQEERYLGQAVLTKDFTYDRQSRLAELTVTDLRTGYHSQTSYRYNAIGQREAKITNGLPTIYANDVAGRVVAEFSADPTAPTGIEEKHYVWAGGRRIAGFTGGTVHYFHVNDIENSRFITDASGAVRSQEWFDAYGNSSLMIGQDLYDFGIFGASRDAESGLYYMGEGSYYDPRVGRFMGKVSITAAAPYLGNKSPTGRQRLVSAYFPTGGEAETGFLGITPDTEVVKKISGAAMEGMDDVGGAGFICIDADYNNIRVSFPLIGTLFGIWSFGGNIFSCTDAAAPLGTISSGLKGAAVAEAKEELMAQFWQKIEESAVVIGTPLMAGFGAIFGGAIGAGIGAGAALIGYLIYKYWDDIAEFFGAGPSYEVLDHSPSSFTATSVNSPKNNRELFNPHAVEAYTKLFGTGQQAGGYIQLLAQVGVVPHGSYKNPSIDQFGLSNEVIRPIEQFNRSGDFNGGSVIAAYAFSLLP